MTGVTAAEAVPANDGRGGRSPRPSVMTGERYPLDELIHVIAFVRELGRGGQIWPRQACGR